MYTSDTSIHLYVNVTRERDGKKWEKEREDRED